MEPTPTANLDRSHDKVYDSTTSVVRAIMELTQGVQKSVKVDYLDLVRSVGLELRSLLGSVDEVVDVFPGHAKHEVEMAHQVLSKDMKDLVSAMRLAEKYSSTTLDMEYRKGMLSAAHVLAMDSKNLLDVIDSIRMRCPEVEGFFSSRTSSTTTAVALPTSTTAPKSPVVPAVVGGPTQ